MIASSSLKIHPFYQSNFCRLHICPGDNKHPVEPGYPNTGFSIEDIQPRLDRGEAQRFCWLLDHNHLTLDLDRHTPDADGIRSLERLSMIVGIDLLKWCRAVLRTPTGGLHLNFLKPADLQIKSLSGYRDDSGNQLFPGVDTLSRSIRNNALVIGAGSLHPDGGTYEWDLQQGQPELVGAPIELLRYLESPLSLRSPVEPVCRFGSPGEDFQKTWEGVDTLAALMSEMGYRFHLVHDAESGQQFYEYIRPGKGSDSRISGYLGKLSSNGNHQLCSFSHSDPLFPEPGRSMTILEALVRVRCEGRGFTEDPKGGKATIRWLAGKKFGRINPDEAFKGRGEASPVPVPDANTAHLPTTVTRTVLNKPTNTFTNTNVEKEVVSGEKEVDKPQHSPLSLAECLKPLMDTGTLMVCGGNLFVHDLDKGIRILDSANALFSWIQERARVFWVSKKPGYVSQAQFYEACLANMPRYDAISLVPHYPKIDGVYYVNDIAPGDPQEFYDFVDHFKPATEEDRLLIMAAIVTPFWGGQAGERPVFLVTSDDPNGVGSGKSTFVKQIARMLALGGNAAIGLYSKSDFDNLGRKLGSQSALNPNTPRIITIDNYKGQAVGGMQIEAMVTEQSLMVHKMYVGDVEVPNYFTWFVTGNSVDTTEDFSQRTVNVMLKKLSQQDYSPDWEEKLRSFDMHKVIAGIGAVLTQVEPQSISKTTRFPSWCRDIIGRVSAGLPGLGDRLIDLILNRSEVISVATADAEYMHDMIQIYINSMGELGEGHERLVGGKVLIQASHMTEQLNFLNKKTMHGKSWSTTFLARRLVESCDRLPQLERYRSMKVKGYLWDKDWVDPRCDE